MNPNSKSVMVKKMEKAANENKISVNAGKDTTNNNSNNNLNSFIAKNEAKNNNLINKNEKVNGDPKLTSNQSTLSGIQLNKKFKDMKKKMINLWETGDEQ